MWVYTKLSALDPTLIINRLRAWNLFGHFCWKVCWIWVRAHEFFTCKCKLFVFMLVCFRFLIVVKSPLETFTYIAVKLFKKRDFSMIFKTNPNSASNRDNPGFKVWRVDLKKRKFEIPFHLEISMGYHHRNFYAFCSEFRVFFLWLRFWLYFF